MAPGTVTERSRRTQAERSASTRAALLQATVDVLIEDGYAGATTRRISDRAGVTRGAQTHHFSSRADLVAEAVRFLAQRLTEDYLGPIKLHPASERAAVAYTIDRLWDFHRSEIFAVALELYTAARTEPEVRECLALLEQDLLVAMGENLAQTLPALNRRKSVQTLFLTTLATMRGLALLAPVHEDDLERQWSSARRHLLALWEEEMSAQNTSE